MKSIEKNNEAFKALSFVSRRIAELEVENERVKAENDKLREFATETIRLMQADGPDCELCKHYDECWAGEATNYSPTGCVICNEARELGIEAGDVD